MNGRQVHVAGEPPTFFTSREADWKARIREALPTPDFLRSEGINLQFVVSSWRRRGHPFDLDNLVKPVLDALMRPDIAFVEAQMRLGSPLGVEITVAAVPSNLPPLTIWFEDLPRGSIQRPDVHPALRSLPSFSDEAPLRVRLDVHEPVSLTDLDFTGFVKPTLDHLWPTIGGTADRASDHRIRHLIVTRSSIMPSGVSIGIETIEPEESEGN